ncbi:hypothetical protein P4O66_013419 [Electrophorus voltai]|uniref:G-protein coupled receptors family 1 profile domain-containing protein n=1 Tax=Electrophorus voltai TaxID=2609070 RepID=A0AAD9DQG6_9TELE|nr:hypothetical protein P4O66_013419 [Electrophorus voltai]
MLWTVSDSTVGQNMSGITDNYGCSDCLTLGRHLNSTESYTYSHVEEGDELLKYIWREYLYPKQYEWVLIAGYIIVFLLSLVGNTLVRIVGKKGHRSIVLIWLVSCIIMVPQAVVIECSSLLPELLPELTNKTIRDEHWGDEIYPKVYHTCFFIVTYFAPLCLMVLAYIQICHKLWCQQDSWNVVGAAAKVSAVQRKSLRCSTQATVPGESVKVRKSTVSAQIKQTRTRRKTARMLIVVLLFFTICYLPISVLNVMKRVFGGFKSMSDREMVYAWFTFTHWLIYANSASNPIIYNFLSGEHASPCAGHPHYTFREEFKAAITCQYSGRGEKRVGNGQDEHGQPQVPIHASQPFRQRVMALRPGSVALTWKD